MKWKDCEPQGYGLVELFSNVGKYVQIFHMQEKRWKEMRAAAKAVVVLLEWNIGGSVVIGRDLHLERLIVPGAGIGRRQCGIRDTHLRHREIHRCPQKKEYGDEAIQS
jgi:hypothetical protein